MRDLIKGLGLVMLLHYGLIKVLRVEAYVEACRGLLGKIPTWLAGRQGWLHPCLPYHWGCTQYVPVLYRHSIGPAGKGPRHVAYSVEGIGECSLQGNDVLDHFCWRLCGCHFCWLRCEGLLWLLVGEMKMWVLKAGMGCCCMAGGCLHWVLLMVNLIGSLKHTDRVVFIKLPWGWVVWCGWSRSVRGSLKVTHLAVFLKPPGEVEVGKWGCLCGSGPWGWGESRIWGEMASSNMQNWVGYDLGQHCVVYLNYKVT